MLQFNIIASAKVFLNLNRRKSWQNNLWGGRRRQKM